jgi:Phage Tail Collar Domain
MKFDRRGFLTGLIVAPAIVRVSSLMAMPRAPWPPFVMDADGRLVCNGALLRASDFPELFSVLGNSYGGSDGHFRLPDLTSCRSSPVELVGPTFRYVINTAPSPLSGPTGTLMLSR